MVQILNLLGLIASVSFGQLSVTTPTDQPNQTSQDSQGAKTTTEQFHPTQEFYNANQQKLILGLEKGRATITGFPTFQQGFACTNTSGNCIKFNDGTTLNTVPTGPALVSTQTWSGINSFQGGTKFGIDSVGSPADSSPITFKAFFVDGVTQSSGCVVAVNMNSVNANGYAQATSSTTVGAGRASVLVTPSCVPLTWCDFALTGVFHAQSQGGQSSNAAFQVSATRCKLRTDASDAGPAGGTTISGLDASNWQWVIMK